MMSEELNKIRALVTDVEYVKTTRPDILHNFYVRLFIKIDSQSQNIKHMCEDWAEDHDLFEKAGYEVEHCGYCIGLGELIQNALDEIKDLKEKIKTYESNTL